MSHPEIPSEIHEWLRETCPSPNHDIRWCGHCNAREDGAEAAWPRLYAAALRHVAWEWDNPTVPQPIRDLADALRHMADEADRSATA